MADAWRVWCGFCVVCLWLYAFVMSIVCIFELDFISAFWWVIVEGWASTLMFRPPPPATPPGGGSPSNEGR